MVYLPFLIMVVALLLGVPIAFALGISALLGIYIVTGNLNTMMGILGMAPFTTVADYALTTIPIHL